MVPLTVRFEMDVVDQLRYVELKTIAGIGENVLGEVVLLPEPLGYHKKKSQVVEQRCGTLAICCFHDI